MIRTPRIRRSHGVKQAGVIRTQEKLISITAELRRRQVQKEHGLAIHLQEQALSSMLRKIIRKANLL